MLNVVPPPGERLVVLCCWSDDTFFCGRLNVDLYSVTPNGHEQSIHSGCDLYSCRDELMKVGLADPVERRIKLFEGQLASELLGCFY